MIHQAYINGKFVSSDKAVVSVMDHGFLYGDGVYETLRVYQGRVFLLEEHLKRLALSAKGLFLPLPMPLKKIGGIIQKTVEINRHREAVVRLFLTRGPGPFGFDTRRCRRPTLVVNSTVFEPYPGRFYSRGITAALVSIRRNNPLCLPPSVKSMNCLNGILAKRESLVLGADEGLFPTLEGHVAEGTVSNVFVVKDGLVQTPALEGSLLAGVTRDWVCSLAKKVGYPLKERKLGAATLLTADEIFLTNTTMEIMPVTRLVVSPRLSPQILKTRLRGWKSPRVGPVARDLLFRFRESI